MVRSVDHSALASIAGIIGLVGRAAWPLFPTRAGILGVQLLIGIAFAVHYALIEIATAAMVNVLGSLQAASALLPLSTRTVRYTGYVLIVAMAAVVIVSWAGATSLLISGGQALMTIARMQQDVCVIFTLLLVGQLLWTVHDILVGSAVAIAADAVGLLVAGWMLGRRWKERR
jgi:hypothetical protein